MNKTANWCRIFKADGLLVMLATAGLILSTSVKAENPPRTPVMFFAVADPQINIPRWGTAGTEKTIALMNALPGKAFPFGGVVTEPLGVIVAGDLVDDLSNPDNWAAYTRFFDPEKDLALLRWPAYEGIGNHDVDVRKQPFGEFNALQKSVIERSKRRKGDYIFDAAGYHHSWEWGGVRFIQLNLFCGNEPRPVYNGAAAGNDPKHSLDFLRHVLAEHVGDSGRPIVLTWHYGLRGWGLEMWWTPEDLDAVADAIKGYNVILILHGHEHRFERYQWQGIDVIMAPSPQVDRDPQKPDTESTPKGFLVFRITDELLQMAHHTADGWAHQWEKPIRRPALSSQPPARPNM